MMMLPGPNNVVETGMKIQGDELRRLMKSEEIILSSVNSPPGRGCTVC